MSSDFTYKKQKWEAQLTRKAPATTLIAVVTKRPINVCMLGAPQTLLMVDLYDVQWTFKSEFPFPSVYYQFGFIWRYQACLCLNLFSMSPFRRFQPITWWPEIINSHIIWLICRVSQIDVKDYGGCNARLGNDKVFVSALQAIKRIHGKYGTETHFLWRRHACISSLPCCLVLSSCCSTSIGRNLQVMRTIMRHLWTIMCVNVHTFWYFKSESLKSDNI